MTDQLFFYVGFSLLIIHEMDAIRCKEWRILPGLALLNDKLGFVVFSLAHIPLFIWLFYGLSQVDNQGLILGLNYFFIVHFVLHVFFLKHKRNGFKDWFSWTIISGTAICGMFEILITEL